MIGHAIVLKNYFPKKNKVTILHERFGKINFFIDEKHEAARLCNGSLMYCEVVKKQGSSSYQCNFVDTYFVPFQSHTDDLYFIHDILKICLEFMPDKMAMKDVFDLVVSMYQQLHDLQDFQKKIYLLRLFLYLGIFPEDKKLYHYVMQNNLLQTYDNDVLLQQGLKYCWNSGENYS